MQPSNLAWLAGCPPLATIRDPAWLQAAAHARIYSLRPRRRLALRAELNDNFLIILRGRVQVYRKEREREVALYRLRGGDVCLFNTITLLLGDPFYPVSAVTEDEVEVATIPREHFQRALFGSPAFRQYVVTTLAQRLTEVLHLLESIVFRRLDVRLAQLLLDKTCDDSDGCICTTHRDLAKELGTSREVISRVLKSFERRGWVRLGRGEIRLRAQGELQAFLEKHLSKPIKLA